MVDEADGLQQPEELDASHLSPSRRKVVLIAAAVVVVALAIAFGVFRAISAGIESAAPRAADYLSPQGEKGAGAPPPAAPAPSEAPQVPGL